MAKTQDVLIGDRATRRNPERNRRALINATLDLIADIGIADTTVSRITEKADLSRGMIHLHFGGKDNLLVAAAKAFSDLYYFEMELQVASMAANPTQLVMAVVRADLSVQILNERSVAIWHAFRGVARTNRNIARYSDTRDKRLRSTLCDAFRALLENSDAQDHGLVANEVTLGTLALLEGMWADFLTHPNDFSRETAVQIIARFLDGIFPGKFRSEFALVE